MPDARDSGAGTLDGFTRSSGRRDFLRMAALGGAGLAIPGLLAACDSGYSTTGVGTPTTSAMIDFSNDIGVLNYAYALEQLEADFYTKVVASPYSGISPAEMALLTAIRDHETIHRDFLAAALGTAKLPNLTTMYPGLDFTSRTAVLTAAMKFEDLGVAAYNGAGQIISKSGNGPTYLLLAGKIVSVEARHAAAIRDVIAGSTGTSFAGDDIIDANGLDRALSPATVLDKSHAGAFISTPVTYSNLPTLAGLSS